MNRGLIICLAAAIAVVAGRMMLKPGAPRVPPAAEPPSATVVKSAALTPVSTTPTHDFTVPPQLPPTAPEPPPPAPDNWQAMPGPERLADLLQRRGDGITESLTRRGFAPGNPVFIRVIKETSELELWLRRKGSTTFARYQTWPVARWSGVLGPKQKEGDQQAPEGCYSVTTRSMNPQSTYHLSFNIGYPNALDLAHQRTGSLIMVHGKNVSIGCYAMTDPVIEEIYFIVHHALASGQDSIPVHCFPFRMTAERLAAPDAKESPWLPFWQDLKQGWDLFEEQRRPPVWTHQNKRYTFTPATL